MRRIAVLSIVTAIALFFAVATSEAVHRGAGNMTCGSCHTMHNMQGGTAIATAAANGPLVLLRGSITTRADIHAMCLSCHSEAGSQGDKPQSPHDKTAPKVHRTTLTWSDSLDFTSIGAGGDFRWTMDTSFALLSDDNAVAKGKGHSLGVNGTGAITPPGGSAISGGFSCTSCHDPHGAPPGDVSTTAGATNSAGTINVFRNLKVKVGGAATGVILSKNASYVGSSTAWKTGTANWSGLGDPLGNNHFWPVSKVATSTTACSAATDCNTYGQSSVSAYSGMSGWCAECHTNWHEGLSAGNADGADWRRHPVNNKLVDSTLSSGADVVVVDWSWYSSLSYTSIQFRLPAAQDVTGTVNNTDPYYADANSDIVFCLSCHFAHGGPYYDNLRWEHVISLGGGVGNTFTATAVPSNRGCQQCHNR